MSKKKPTEKHEEKIVLDEAADILAEEAAPEACDAKPEADVLDDGTEPCTVEGQEVLTPKEAALAEALLASEAQRDEYLNVAQRVQADFENFRRRNQNLRKEAYEDGAKAFVSVMLPVVDNLERALDAAKESADEALREGVELVYRQLCEAFEKQGISPICRLGEKFDPALENAVLQGSSEDGEPGTVCEVFQKGYQMKEAVLRHAMVKVVPE